ncbi:MAG: putative zinc-binding metallopeptidase [Oligoflexia bacterium]|nr:putative zinc-binding metallopeptidase [Oligoflexia bacterium]
MSNETKQPKIDISTLSDDELLGTKICDLDLSIESSDLFPIIVSFYQEFEEKHLPHRPKIYLGDEWFSPEGMNAISIPFYLAHPRLKQLEQKIMLEVEGGSEDWCLRLLRHEAGHCFDHTYGFSKRRKWASIFGSPERTYAPETYRPRPYSKSFVKNLGHWYAQSHPDEDFAETFAVWLRSDRSWKEDYKNLPVALEKLRYIEQLALECPKLQTKNVSGRLPYAAKNSKISLKKYYDKRKKENEDEYPDFYDTDLKKIFNGDTTLPKREYSAERFLSKNRKHLVNVLAWATSEKKITIDSFLKKLIERSNRLDLRLGKPELETMSELSCFLTSLVKNYLFTGKFKRKV